MLQWQVNRGVDAAAETVAVSEIPRMRRPDALPSVLQELGTARALGIADIKAARSDVQRITRPAKPPGERLHVLTIGISDNGDKAKNLRLKFADKDARDVASALLNTQGGGLYAEVKPMLLSDDQASWDGIFAALAAMELYMAAGTGQDLAIVMFSGHGTVIDGQFYLLPYGVDDSTSAHLKSSAILATEFQSEISKLAAHGRVLVLLDACRSARMLPNADKLRSLLDVNNVTVLTSSIADKVLREDEKWRHGAFTKVLLDALSASDIDADKNGVISMTELTDYVGKHLSKLTDNDQQLGLALRFGGDIFVAGRRRRRCRNIGRIGIRRGLRTFRYPTAGLDPGPAAAGCRSSGARVDGHVPISFPGTGSAYISHRIAQERQVLFDETDFLYTAKGELFRRRHAEPRPSTPGGATLARNDSRMQSACLG